MWLKRNAAPLVWFVLWILIVPIVLPVLDTRHSLAGNLVFYTGLLAYVFIRNKPLDREAVRSLGKKRTWLHIALTLVGLGTAYGLAALVISMFPGADTGWASLQVCDGWSLLLFFILTVILAPITEELFFRRSLIALDGTKNAMIATAAASCVLFGLAHSLMPLGFVEGALFGLVFAVSYIKTGNIVVPLAAHLIANAALNGASVLLFVWRMFGG